MRCELENTNFAISADRYNWVLEERKVNKKTGEARWDNCGNFPGPGACLARLNELTVVDGETLSLQELIAVFESLNESLRKGEPQAKAAELCSTWSNREAETLRENLDDVESGVL